jgi:hypothetical protein
MFIRLRETPGHAWLGAQVSVPGRREKRVLIVGQKSDGQRSFPGLVHFRLVAPLLQSGVVGSFPGTRCMVPQPFAAGGNLSYLKLWTVTGGTRYPGYLPR